MTKEEKDNAIADIKSRLGEPEFDFDHTPLNESAKQILAIQDTYRRERINESRAKAKALKEQKELNEIAKETFVEKESKGKAYFKKDWVPLELYVAEEDLKIFDDTEKRIIQHKLKNFFKTNVEIAQAAHVSVNAVTALFKTPAYKLLVDKVIDNLLPTAVKFNLLTQATADPKVNMRLAEHYGIVKPEKQELEINKPIDDPAVLKMLKDLGDKASEE